jgi:hypothetical protein
MVKIHIGFGLALDPGQKEDGLLVRQYLFSTFFEDFRLIRADID